MALSKDKTQLKYNAFLTLSGIPPEVHGYRLGNRSALEWFIDEYRVSTDKRSGILDDPNREDDPEYIVRLIGQVVTVSLGTVCLVRELSALPLLPPAPQPAHSLTRRLAFLFPPGNSKELMDSLLPPITHLSLPSTPGGPDVRVRID